MLHYPRLKDNACSRFELGWVFGLELESATSEIACLIIGMYALLGYF